MAKWYLRIAGFFVWVVLMFAAQISPDSAVSNISKWFALFNIRVPDALKNKTADVWIFWIFLILGGFYFLILIINFLRKHWYFAWKISKPVEKKDERAVQAELSNDTINHYRRKFFQLQNSQIDALKKMLIALNANDVSDSDWQLLERAGFVERDFVGKVGVKNELKPLVAQLIEEIEKIKAGYAEFLRLCRVHDPNDWEPGFKIKTDGVWVDPPKEDDDATTEERAVLSEHPFKDLSKPVLRFPCSLKEFNEFIEWAGMTGYVDQTYLKNLIKEQNREAIWRIWMKQKQ